MATVIITGGTGLIGTAISKALAFGGDDVIILTRDVGGKNNEQHISYAAWDPGKQTIDEEAIKKADHIIHLAGANVAEGRWTAKRKQEIIDSRVKSGELIVKAIKEIPNKIRSVISSSAIGYYGQDPQIPNPKPFVETDKPANDFLGTVVQKWEAAIEPVMDLGKRLVILRTGIVLSKKGGAYYEFRKPLRFGIASVLGRGTQMVSWIQMEDLVRMYLESMRNEKWSGVYNVVAPVPVSNKELIQQIAKQVNKHYITVPVPEFVLKMVLGEMSVEVLKSTTVSAVKAEDEAEFIFYFPSIGNAIQRLEAF